MFASPADIDFERLVGAFTNAVKIKSFQPLCELGDCKAVNETVLSVTELASKEYIYDSNPPLLLYELFKCAGLQLNPETAFALLCDWGKAECNENIFLRQVYKNDRTFYTSEDIDELIRKPAPDPHAFMRTDLRHLTSFAIDSADTEEVDDAISWDEVNERICVHVADPSRYFPSTAALDENNQPRSFEGILQTALQRMETLYLPEQTLYMFPKKLVKELLSLDGKKGDGTTITFSFQIEPTTGNILNPSTELSIIQKPVRLTPEQASWHLEDENAPYFRDFEKLRRVGKRGFERPPKEEIFVTYLENFDGPHIDFEIKGLDLYESVSELVEVIMNNAKEVARRFLQNPRNIYQNITWVGDASKKNRVNRKMLKVTSPIRRASDLFNQIQIKHMLANNGRGLFDSSCSCMYEYLWRKRRDVHMAVREQTERFWKREYLRRTGRSVSYEVVVTYAADTDEFETEFSDERLQCVPFTRTVFLNEELLVDFRNKGYSYMHGIASVTYVNSRNGQVESEITLFEE